MSSAEAAAGGVKQCRQAQGQLEDAINSVLKAEQQLRDNVREVSTYIIVSFYSNFPSFTVNAYITVLLSLPAVYEGCKGTFSVKKEQETLNRFFWLSYHGNFYKVKSQNK